jgi:hypothetical protein
MQKLSVVEGEAYMAGVLLRTVRCRPGRLCTARKRPRSGRFSPPSPPHALPGAQRGHRAPKRIDGRLGRGRPLTTGVFRPAVPWAGGGGGRCSRSAGTGKAYTATPGHTDTERGTGAQAASNDGSAVEPR